MRSYIVAVGQWRPDEPVRAIGPASAARKVWSQCQKGVWLPKAVELIEVGDTSGRSYYFRFTSLYTNGGSPEGIRRKAYQRLMGSRSQGPRVGL